MKKIILLLLTVLCATTIRAQKQNIVFNHLTTDDGLSQFSVNCLYVDEQGVLWIGTREGLNRYNGNDIQTFKLQKNDPNSLFCNNILRITGDRQGKVFLLCTEGGGRVRPRHPKVHNPPARKCHRHPFQQAALHREKRRNIRLQSKHKKF